MLFQQNSHRLLVHTPAKLNLYLEVIGRRDDGYHELETCMVSVDLYDTLRFRPADSGSPLKFSVRSLPGQCIPEGPENLVLKAAELLRQRSGTEASARIELVKRIPSEAGMGGGSSNAAATLLGLNRLWGLGCSGPELHGMAAELGSDLNFFVEQASAAICRGRGECVEPIFSPNPMSFVVAMPPGASLSTADVFRACTYGDQRELGDFLDGFHSGSPSVHNRLSAAAAQLCPKITALSEEFSRLKIPNELTGSGAAWFGIAKNRRTAARYARIIRSRGFERTWAVSMTS